MDPDHRDLNHDMHLFTTHPLAGAGLPLWLPAGAAIRDELQRLAKELAHADGCVDVYSPVLGKRALYERSGHLTKFGEDMFPSLALADDDVVMLRPANCPHHALIYASSQHSYRELPIRLNELGSMFRAERSGVLSGLSRVRQISLDDTHVFCRPDQVVAEAALGLRTAIRAQQILGLPVDHVRLSLRDDGEGWLGTREEWDAAEDSLRHAAAQALDGIPLEVAEADGEAAFYGPKLDLQVIDRRGHDETIATVQLDFNQPERFDLTYVAADNTSQRVVMIHRGTVGSMERVTAALLEHYDGRLPFWLAPTQVAVLPVAPEQDVAVAEFVDQARARGLRVRTDHDGALGARIRRARVRRDHLIAVIGSAEVSAGTTNVTDVAGGVRIEVDRDALLDLMTSAHEDRQRSVAWP